VSDDGLGTKRGVTKITQGSIKPQKKESETRVDFWVEKNQSSRLFEKI